MAAMPQIQPSQGDKRHTQPLPGYWTLLSGARGRAAALKRVHHQTELYCHQNSRDTAAAAKRYQKGAENHHSTTESLFRVVRDIERDREELIERWITNW